MSVRYRQPQNGRAGYWYIETTWPDGMRTRPTMPDEATAIRINKKIEVAIVDEERIWKKLRRELRLEGGVLQGLSEFADLYYESYVKTHNRAHEKKKNRLDILKRYFSSLPIDSLTPPAHRQVHLQEEKRWSYEQDCQPRSWRAVPYV